MYYVFDVYGDGYVTVSKNLPKERNIEVYIGEYSSHVKNGFMNQTKKIMNSLHKRTRLS